jgi:ligand-binding sensor domain-containing protein
LFEDSRSNLWVGTDTAGAALIAQGRVEPLKIGRGQRRGHLVSICEDSTGAVWLLTEDGQLGRYAKGPDRRVEMKARMEAQSVIADKDGKVWIGTGNKILSLNPAAVRSGAPLPVTDGPEVRQRIGFVAGQPRRRLLVSGRWRIRKYSGTQVEKDFGPYPWTNGLDTVKAACEDREGHLIVGTGGPYGRAYSGSTRKDTLRGSAPPTD